MREPWRTTFHTPLSAIHTLPGFALTILKIFSPHQKQKHDEENIKVDGFCHPFHHFRAYSNRNGETTPDLFRTLP